MTKTVEKTSRTLGGKDYPVTITKIFGRAEYIKPDGSTIMADEYFEFDWGPKLGVTRQYGIYPDITPEENERRRAESSKLIGRLAVGL